MKSYKTVITSICLLLAACQSDNYVLDENFNYQQNNKIRISATINNKLQTKGSGSEIYTDYTENKTIGLIINCSDDNNDYSNAQWTYSSDTETWSNTSGTPMLWGNSTSTNTVLAYAPYNSIFDDESYTFSANTDQSTESNLAASDFVTYKAINYTPGTDSIEIPIMFSHKLTKLIINFSHGDQYDDNFTDYTVSINAKNKSTYTQSDDVDRVSITANTKDITPFLSGNKAEVIIAPQTIIAGTRLITFNIDDDTYYFITPEEYTFASGEYTTLNIRIGKDKLELEDGSDGITVGSWNKGTDIYGTVSPYK